MSDEISVAEVVGLCSALADIPVRPCTIICGRVVMSGSMMPITTELEELFVAVVNAGAKTVLLPDDCKKKYSALRKELKKGVTAEFYTTPLDAAKKALQS